MPPHPIGQTARSDEIPVARCDICRLYRYAVSENGQKQSVEVFGGFIHTYKFNEAVKDGAVRTIKLTCKPNIRANAWRFIGQLQYRNCRHMVESGTRKKKPPECLEYVVVHELIHLLERRHNARFMAQPRLHNNII